MDKQHATPYQQQLVAMRTALLAQMAEQRGGEVSRAEAASAHFSHSEESPAQMATEKEIGFAIGDHEAVELSAITAPRAHNAAGTPLHRCTITPAPRIGSAVAPRSLRRPRAKRSEPVAYERAAAPILHSLSGHPLGRACGARRTS